MDWSEVLDIVIRVIIVPIIPLLAVYIKLLLETKIDEIKAKTDNQNIKKQLDIARQVLSECVTDTSETYVKTLKEQGEFGAEAQKIAFEKTKSKFLSIISEGTKIALETTYGDYTKWIETSIENLVKSNK